MWAIILQTSLVCCFTANAEQLPLHDHSLIQQGLDVGNTGATAETMGVDTHGRRRRRRRWSPRRRSRTRVFCSNDINGGDQVCTQGCYSKGKCTGSCRYYSVNGDNTSAVHCGCNCKKADPSTVNVVDKVNAAPQGMVLDKNPTWTPAFCIGRSSKNVPIPGFLLRKMPSLENLSIALVVCWGKSYGTAIGLSGSIPGWSIVGQIHWAKSIFGVDKRAVKPNGCLFCRDNKPGGKIVLCRSLVIGNYSIVTNPTLAQWIQLKIEIGGKVCMGLGIESDALDSSRTNVYFQPMGGITSKFTFNRVEVVGDALFTGKITLKNLHWNPFGKNDGLSFQAGLWMALYWNDKKFAEVSIELSEEWAIYVTGLKNVADDSPILNKAAHAAVNSKGIYGMFMDRVRGSFR